MRSNQRSVDITVNVLEHIEDYTHTCLFTDFDGNLGRAAVREVELAGGDAAEGDAATSLLFGKI